jgi:5'-deoxynucleotidase YfbR-like HD superfamily hydrolase
MFDVRERMLAFVERWNVAPRLHRQSVAEHSYFVALYASDISAAMSLTAVERANVLDYALRHDMAEIVTGDMPGPAKRALVDIDKLKEYEEDFMISVGQESPGEWPDYCKQIVKAADCIDAYFWISMEVLRGNAMMINERYIALDRMRIAVVQLGYPEWAGQVEDEAERMASGIPLSPRLDTDLPAQPDHEELPF